MGGFLGRSPTLPIPHLIPKTLHEFQGMVYGFMTRYVGTEVPVWDIAKHYNRGDTHNLLVSNQALGAALASAFTSTQSYAARAGAMGVKLVSSLIKSDESTRLDLQPDHPVVLMRGHGFTALGGSIKEVVYRAIYTSSNASIQTASLLLRNAHLAAEERGESREEREKGVKDGRSAWFE